MTIPESKFLFTTCQVGAEPALKKEMSQINPLLHFAFSRPGFVTFKNANGTLFSPDFELSSIFARTYGVSLGKIAANPEEVFPFVERIQQGSPLRLHFWERDHHAPGKAPMGYIPGQLSEPSQKHLHVLASHALFYPDSVAQPGDLVLDVVVVEENEWWIGLHVHSVFHSPFPGARPSIAIPSEAPSRAYLKLEEAILAMNIPLRAGETAVELGSAPGGACYALLKRGLKVVGIDPGKMDPVVLKMPGFHHIASPVAQVLREDLPSSVEWLLLDMNVTPNLSLFAVDRLASRMSSSLKGVLLTLKLNEWALADDIPFMLEHLRAMGFTKLKVKQLASSGREIFVYGVTKKLERKRFS